MSDPVADTQSRVPGLLGRAFAEMGKAAGAGDVTGAVPVHLKVTVLSTIVAEVCERDLWRTVGQVQLALAPSVINYVESKMAWYKPFIDMPSP